jgi:hypothetical protein
VTLALFRRLEAGFPPEKEFPMKTLKTSNRTLTTLAVLGALALSAPSLPADEPDSGSAPAPETEVVAVPSRQAADVTEECVHPESPDLCINITDAIHLITWLYSGGEEPRPVSCLVEGQASGDFAPVFPEPEMRLEVRYSSHLRAADVNGDGRIDITDPIALLNFLFLGGERPAPIACEAVSSSSV